jgi:hypothetical protein
MTERARSIRGTKIRDENDLRPQQSSVGLTAGHDQCHGRSRRPDQTGVIAIAGIEAPHTIPPVGSEAERRLCRDVDRR